MKKEVNMTAVIDTHLHLWDLAGDYAWLTPAYGPIYRTFTPDEAAAELARAGVDRAVLVQAADTYADTESMLAVADRYSFVAGVVGWVPLDRPNEAAQALDRFAAHRAFKGVRHLIHEEPDPDWVVQPSVLDGLRLLAERDLSFDVVAVLPRHLEHVPALAEAVPGLRLVIDHLAKPPIKDRGWEPWATLLRRAADYPNVYAKISGLNTAADWASWSAEDLRPYVEHALTCFGPNRLMFGSDWPVAILAGDYQKVWEETQRVLMHLSEADQRAIFTDTARTVYRLEV
jgi:L-fuconolactonase